jgi:hypothetical protein
MKMAPLRILTGIYTTVNGGYMGYKPLEVSLLDLAGVGAAMKAMRLPKGGVPGTQAEDLALAGKLIRAGDDHAKAMRGIIVWLEMRMQVGFMVEFETYRHGVECLSTSSTMHGDLKGMRGYELAEAKQEALPDLVYHRIVCISYQALRSMFMARRGHRHPDWQRWCRFCKTLPYFNHLIMPEGLK